MSLMWSHAPFCQTLSRHCQLRRGASLDEHNMNELGNTVTFR